MDICWRHSVAGRQSWHTLRCGSLAEKGGAEVQLDVGSALKLVAGDTTLYRVLSEATTLYQQVWEAWKAVVCLGHCSHSYDRRQRCTPPHLQCVQLPWRLQDLALTP